MTVLETPKNSSTILQREVDIVWQNCLKMIRESISEQSYKTWFEPIVPAKLEGRKLTIQVPSQFFYEWLEENYVHLLRKSLDYAIGRDGMLEYSIVVDSGNRQKNEPQIAVNMPPVHSPQYAKPDNHTANVVKNPFQMKDLDSLSLDSYLNPNYTFDNFVEGDCNRLARAAGFAVASKPGVTSFNPLMIYGGVGLGKTHLVQAIGNFMKNKAGGKFVLYVSSEKFTSQFINSIKIIVCKIS